MTEDRRTRADLLAMLNEAEAAVSRLCTRLTEKDSECGRLVETADKERLAHFKAETRLDMILRVMDRCLDVR